jgi:PAS domain-containing protein
MQERLRGLSNPLGLLEGIFAFAPVALQVYRADGHSVLVNRAFVALFGSEPPAEYNVLKDDVAARGGFLPLIHRAFAGETVEFGPHWYDPRELEHVCVTEGRRVSIEAVAFPLLDEKGAVTHIAVVFKDATT